MRLLPVGEDDVRFAAAGEQPQSDGCRYRRRDVRQHLPLRDLCPHSRSDQRGRAIEPTGGLTMILDPLTPRSFLRAGAAPGGGLMLILSLPVAKHDPETAGSCC